MRPKNWKTSKTFDFQQRMASSLEENKDVNLGTLQAEELWNIFMVSGTDSTMRTALQNREKPLGGV